MSASTCPLCGSPLYGWLTLPDPASHPTVGRMIDEAAAERVIERCENCGLGVEASAAPLDLAREADLLARQLGDGRQALVAANRASWQAGLGGEGWAALDQRPGRLIFSPRSLELLAERTGRPRGEVAFTRFGRNQRDMWQTLLNGLTLHPNFVREVRAGRMRPGTARNRFAFFADCVASALAAPLVALVSVPLELVAAVARRGGEIALAARTGPS